MLLLKSAADAMLLVSLGMLLAIIIPSSNYVKLDLYQRLINYFALGLVYISLWGGLSFLLSLLFFGRENETEIRTLISITVWIGLFMFVIQMQVIHFQMLQKKEEHGNENKTIATIHSRQFHQHRFMRQVTRLKRRRSLNV